MCELFNTEVIEEENASVAEMKFLDGYEMEEPFGKPHDRREVKSR